MVSTQRSVACFSIVRPITGHLEQCVHDISSLVWSIDRISAHLEVLGHSFHGVRFGRSFDSESGFPLLSQPWKAPQLASVQPLSSPQHVFAVSVIVRMPVLWSLSIFDAFERHPQCLSLHKSFDS